MKFAVRVTRHNKNLWIARLECWSAGVMVRTVERRDTTLKSALGRARAEFRTKRKAK
jgi:hypothetical protein